MTVAAFLFGVAKLYAAIIVTALALRGVLVIAEMQRTRRGALTASRGIEPRPHTLGAWSVRPALVEPPHVAPGLVAVLVLAGVGLLLGLVSLFG